MSRLIDADKINYYDHTECMGHGDFETVRTVTDKEIAEIPTVDAVEVVRCRDCKHYEIHKPKVLENCERNGYIIPMKPDDFCSYGERKEGAGNG